MARNGMSRNPVVRVILRGAVRYYSLLTHMGVMCCRRTEGLLILLRYAIYKTERTETALPASAIVLVGKEGGGREGAGGGGFRPCVCVYVCLCGRCVCLL